MLLATLFILSQTLHLERLPVTVTRPVALAFAPEDDARVYIAEASGVVRVAVNGVLRDKPFLDISAKVQQPTSGNGETGFLNLAFSPNHDKRGNLTVYVHYVNLSNQNVVEMHKVKSKNKAKPKPKGAPLLVSQAAGIGHYGGKLNWGPDGYLYTSLGDGGDKPAAQSLESWRGKVIRFGDFGLLGAVRGRVVAQIHDLAFLPALGLFRGDVGRFRGFAQVDGLLGIDRRFHGVAVVACVGLGEVFGRRSFRGLRRLRPSRDIG